MTALAKSRPLSRRVVNRAKRPVGANVKIYKGASLVAIGGYYVPATGALGETIIGTSEEEVDNLGGALGAKLVDVDFHRERRLVALVNDTGAPVVATSRESFCSLLDDQTATLLAPARGPGALVYDVDTSEGLVWVELPQIPTGLGAGQTIRSGTATLAAGTVTISAPITAGSRILATMKDAGAGALTGFADLEIPAASRNVGAGTFVVRAIDASKAVIGTAVCTFDWFVIG